jgi:hypothetical protein
LKYKANAFLSKEKVKDIPCFYRSILSLGCSFGRQSQSSGRFRIEVQAENGRRLKVAADGIKHRLTALLVFIMIQGGSNLVSI